MTLAVIKALLFEAGDRSIAIPVASSPRSRGSNEDALTTVDGRTDAPAARPGHLGDRPARPLRRIAGDGQGKICLDPRARAAARSAMLIDRLLWQQELVIKAVDAELVPTRLRRGRLHSRRREGRADPRRAGAARRRRSARTRRGWRRYEHDPRSRRRRFRAHAQDDPADPFGGPGRSRSWAPPWTASSR